jgi:Mg2+/Co2+ transporter CorB
MNRLDTKPQRLVALCLLGFLLFNYPILALFNRAGLLFGIPVLYAYIFAAWAVLIVLMAIVVERSGG